MEPIHKLAMDIIMDPHGLLMYCLPWTHLGFLYGAP